jgi:hypothetical protein
MTVTEAGALPSADAGAHHPSSAPVLLLLLLLLLAAAGACLEEGPAEALVLALVAAAVAGDGHHDRSRAPGALMERESNNAMLGASYTCTQNAHRDTHARANATRSPSPHTACWSSHVTHLHELGARGRIHTQTSQESRVGRPVEVRHLVLFAQLLTNIT